MAKKLMAVTTGVGKTRQIIEVKDRIISKPNKAVLVTVETKEQAEPYQAAGFAMYHGRSDKEGSAGYCFRYELVNQLGDNNQSVAEYCLNCVHGIKAEIELADDDDKRAELEEQLSKRIIFARVHEEPMPCPSIIHQDEISRCKAVVACHQAMSNSLIHCKAEPDHDPIKRMVFIDEKFTKARRVVINKGHIEDWLKQVRGDINIIEVLAKAIDNPNYASDDLKSCQSLENLFEWFIQLIDDHGADDGYQTIQVDDDRKQQIMDAVEYSKALAMALHGRWTGKAEFEEIEPYEDKPKSIPLRALSAIAECVKIDSSIVVAGQMTAKDEETNELLESVGLKPKKAKVGAAIYVYEISQTSKAIIDGDHIAVLDATPDRATRSMFDQEQTEEHIERQNISVIRHCERYFASSSFKDGAPQAKKDASIARARTIVDHHLYNGDVVLSHMSLMDELGLLEEGHPYADSVGYFGRDHRAHNRWSGRNMAIIGSFVPSNLDWPHMYNMDRLVAMASGAEPADWPVWSDEKRRGYWINEGKKEVEAFAIELPTNEKHREWLLDYTTNETVQAIGRLRGVNHEGEPLTVHIYGGLPLYQLWKHGITVDEYSNSDQLGRTTKQWKEKDHGDERSDALLQAVNAMRLNGELISYRSLSAKMKEMSGHGLSKEAYQELHDKLYPMAPHMFKPTGRPSV